MGYGSFGHGDLNHVFLRTFGTLGDRVGYFVRFPEAGSDGTFTIADHNNRIERKTTSTFYNFCDTFYRDQAFNPIGLRLCRAFTFLTTSSFCHDLV